MRSRYKFADDDEGLYFITSTIIEWLPIFTRKPYFDIIINSLDFCIKNKSLHVYGYVIMDNHLHMIISAPWPSRIIQDFKSFTAKEIIKILTDENKQWLLNQLEYYKKKHKIQSKHQVWQEGVHPQKIISEDMMRQKLNYMHNNPVEAGFVERPEFWIHSSASNYASGAGILNVELISML